MKQQHNRQQTLECLENDLWPPLQGNEYTHLVITCHTLRKKPICQFTVEDCRMMIGQEIGLPYLIPLAIEKLTENVFVEGNYYPGDLLKTVLDVNISFWKNNKEHWLTLHHLLKAQHRQITSAKIDTTKFYSHKQSA